MASEKIVALVERLIEKTQDGDLEWEQTPWEGTFQAGFPNYSVHVLQIVDRGQEDYAIRLYNAAGQLIEEVRDTDVKDEIDMAFTKMKAMHEAARRRAMGVDKAVDEILNALD